MQKKKTQSSSAVWTDAEVDPRANRGADRIWSRREREICAAGDLSDDWDGEGADAPSAGVVQTALHLVRAIWERGDWPPPSRVSVTSDGTIVLEWRILDSYVEAEIENPGSANWMVKMPGARTS